MAGPSPNSQYWVRTQPALQRLLGLSSSLIGDRVARLPQLLPGPGHTQTRMHKAFQRGTSPLLDGVQFQLWVQCRSLSLTLDLQNKYIVVTLWKSQHCIWISKISLENNALSGEEDTQIKSTLSDLLSLFEYCLSKLFKQFV